MDLFSLDEELSALAALADDERFQTPAAETPKRSQDEIDLETLDLRAAGFSYRQIARHQGVHLATAYARVQRGIRVQRETYYESPADVRDLELAKLARFERALMPKAVEGDLGSIRLALRISDLKQRLLQIKTPTALDELMLEHEADQQRRLARKFVDHEGPPPAEARHASQPSAASTKELLDRLLARLLEKAQQPAAQPTAAADAKPVPPAESPAPAPREAMPPSRPATPQPKPGPAGPVLAEPGEKLSSSPASHANGSPPHPPSSDAKSWPANALPQRPAEEPPRAELQRGANTARTPREPLL